MKKVILLALIVAVLLLTSCGAALTGAALGGSLGSAIGGISGGGRGHDIGLLVGTVGGAMVGAAVDQAAQQKATKQQTSDYEQYQAEKARLAANREARNSAQEYDDDYYDDGEYYDDDDYFDPTNSGDDSIDLAFGDTADLDGSIEEIDDSDDSPYLQIRNVRFVDTDGSNEIERGEQCSIVFEIYNNSSVTAYNIEPSVTETATNGHIAISPSILIESLAANKGVKYTARLVADNNIKDGNAYFIITLMMDGEDVGNGVQFSIPTNKN